MSTPVLLSICASAQCYGAVAFPPGQQANNSCERAAIVVVVQVDDVWGIFNYLQSSLFTSNSLLLFTSHNTIAVRPKTGFALLKQV